MRKTCYTILAILAGAACLSAADVEAKHFQMLYTVVRVKSAKATGSGTVLYSAKDKSGVYHTYVLTNYHVIENLVAIDKMWDPVLKRKIDKEVLGKPTVEFFQYNRLSDNIGTFSAEAEIVAYDGAEDMALLRLKDTEKPAKYVAKMCLRSAINDIHLYDEVWAAGAALGHAPIITNGHLTYQNEVIDNYDYWMSTALTIFGNSGGAVFRNSSRGYEFIGIPSRISVTFGGQAITHLGYFIPVSRVYGFLERSFYQFIYDSSYTPEKCSEMRQKQVSLSIGQLRREDREGTK